MKAETSSRLSFVRGIIAAYLVIFPLAVAIGQEPKSAAPPHHKLVPLTADTAGGVVSGDPNKPGAPFVIRIRSEANQIIPVHWHPEDENITVVKGTWCLGSGDKFDLRAMQEMNVGDYALMPKKMRHFAWSKTEAVIQVHGIGPFKIVPNEDWELLSGWKETPEQGLVRDEKANSAFRFHPNDRVNLKSGAGVVVGGVHIPSDRLTQYEIHRDDGVKAFEFEEDLSLVAPVAQRTYEPGVLNGRWACVAEGGPWGRVDSNLYIRHEANKANGVFTWPGGGAVFSFLTSEARTLEIGVETGAGKVLHTGKYDGNNIEGQWHDSSGGRGDWKCEKTTKN